MTDNEIIKALDCCVSANYICPHTCPMLKNKDCLTSLRKNALDLITRQQAEIENLKNENFILSQKRANIFEITDAYERGKAKAYKEFAERLKNEIISDTAYGCDSSQHTGYYDYQIKIGDIPEYIDNLVKEMVGENNE